MVFTSTVPEVVTGKFSVPANATAPLSLYAVPWFIATIDSPFKVNTGYMVVFEPISGS